MNNPSVSVLMSAYNAEKYVGEAIESILNQTFKDYEFIIIDDASTDKTLSQIKNYTDNRIVIIQNEKNLKLAASLNKGLRIAKGKYIARMDADDISDLTRLEKQFDFLERYPEIDICGTAMQLFGNEKGTRYYRRKDKEIKAGMIWAGTISHGTVLMRHDKIIKHKLFYDETFHVGQDWKYWYDAKDQVVFSNLLEPLYFCRRGQQNITVKHGGSRSIERYATMHKAMLGDMKISFTEQELGLHQFIIGQFKLAPSPGVIKDAKKWLNKLINHNRSIKAYDVMAFDEISKYYWSDLFYKLIPFGFRNVFTYFMVTGISPQQMIYYIKQMLRKPQKIQNN